MYIAAAGVALGKFQNAWEKVIVWPGISIFTVKSTVSVRQRHSGYRVSPVPLVVVTDWPGIAQLW
jgi:hypothetical protein